MQSSKKVNIELKTNSKIYKSVTLKTRKRTANEPQNKQKKGNNKYSKYQIIVKESYSKNQFQKIDNQEKNINFPK